MTNPLTKEQIELLRNIATENDHFSESDEEDRILYDLEDFLTIDCDHSVINSAGRTLLATIDQMEAEREGEVRLAGEYQGGYCVDGETQITVTAMTIGEDINNRKAFESLHAGPCEITIRPIKEGGE